MRVCVERGWGRILWSLMIFFRCLKFKFFFVFFSRSFFLSLTHSRSRQKGFASFFIHFSYTQHSFDAVNSPRLTLSSTQTAVTTLLSSSDILFWFESDVTAFQVGSDGMISMSLFESYRKSMQTSIDELQTDESLSCSITCNRRMKVPIPHHRMKTTKLQLFFSAS